MASFNFKVVCGFNGTTYSRYFSRKAAERAAEKTRRGLRSPSCGSLASYVKVVPATARFSRIVPADNEFGCCSLSAPVWTD